MRDVEKSVRNGAGALAVVLPPLLLVMAAGQAGAQSTRTWRSAADGVFTAPANWVASSPPGPGDTAQFGFSSSLNPFTVTFLGDAATSRLTLTNQRPVFNLGGFTYSVSSQTVISGFNAPHLTVLNGTLNLGGGGESLIVGQNAGQAGNLTIGNGAVVTGLREIGRAGSGSLSILDGGRASNLNNSWLYTGTASGGSGDILVSGAGSMLDLSEGLYLGWNGGQGSLRVDGGGRVDVAGVLDMGVSSNTTNEVIVDGTDSLISIGGLTKHDLSTGNLSVLNGGRLEVAAEVNLYGQGTASNILVDGPGSVFDPGFLLYTRDSTDVTLTITNGGAVDGGNDLNFTIAAVPGSTTAVVVDGPGSTLTSQHFRSDWGSASIEITDGGLVRCFDEFRMGLGFQSGTNSLRIRGAGSELIAGDFPNTGGEFLFGFEHNSTNALVDQGGRLTILNNSYIAHRGTGSLTIDGAGSSLETPYRVHVGWGSWRPSHGMMTLSNGAVASIGSLGLDALPDGSAYVIIDGPGTLVQAVGPSGSEIHSRGTIVVSDGAGLEVSPWIQAYGTMGADPNDTKIGVSSGAYLFSTGGVGIGWNDGRTASMVLDDGLVFCNDTFSVNAAGVLRGAGTIDAPTLSTLGRIEPGLPIGVLTVNNIQFNPGIRPNPDFETTLAIEIGGLGTDHDAISANGSANLGGTLALSLVDGFAPSAGDTFDILTTAANQRFGIFEAITGSNAGPGLAFVPQYLHDRVRLVVDGVTGFDIDQASVAVAAGFIASPLTATATFVSSALTEVALSATWSTDNPAVATVDETGLITGVGEGNTTVRGTYAGLEDTVTVTVRATPEVIDGTPGLATTGYRRGFVDVDFLGLTPDYTMMLPQINGYPGDPFAVVNRDNFQAQFKGQIVVPSDGVYTFYLSADDDAVLRINDQYVTHHQVFLPEVPGVIELAAGIHDVLVDFVEYGGGDNVRLDWEVPGFSRQTIPPSAFVAGVNAEFFNGVTIPLVNDVPDFDPFIEFRYFITSDLDHPIFSNSDLAYELQRFEGQLALPDDAEYTFTLNVDDDAKVWINGTLVIDAAWSNFAFGAEHTGSITLNRGVHDIRVDYTNHGGHFAGIQLRVSAPGIVEQIVPAAVFSHGGSPPPSCPADLAPPAGLLDLADITTFIIGFTTQDPVADLAEPFGLLDLADINAFVTSFVAGCP